MLDRYRVELRDSYEGIDDGPFDRVVLDLPEPWQVIPHAERVLHAGGHPRGLHAVASSRPSQAREALRGRWIDARTIEVLHRGWHIEGDAVRPDHRMVAHTGFLTVARYLGVGARAIAADSSGRRRADGAGRRGSPTPDADASATSGQGSM